MMCICLDSGYWLPVHIMPSVKTLLNAALPSSSLSSLSFLPNLVCLQMLLTQKPTVKSPSKIYEMTAQSQTNITLYSFQKSRSLVASLGAVLPQTRTCKTFLSYRGF